METLEQSVKFFSQLTIKTPEQRHWRRSGVSIVNFEQITDFTHYFGVSIVDFEQVNAGWVHTKSFIGI